MNIILSLLQTTPAGAVPISGFALCFIPLVAIIVGFIVFARFTDRRATGTYLRILPSKQSDDAA
jgi:hypothetical protein